MTATTNAQDEYRVLLALILETFTERVSSNAIFTTDAAGLVDAYLQALPEEARQHHTCTACRRFIEGFGGLVTISEDGVATPAIWDVDAPPYYRAAINAMAAIVKRAKVTGVFLSAEKVWGRPITGPWTHFAVTPPDSLIFRSLTRSAFEVAAEKKQDYLTMLTALAEFPLAVIEQAVTVLQAEALYRSEKCLGVAKWLKDLHERREGTKNGTLKANILWRAVAGAPAGFCHPRSSMIGTLLEDIAAGLPFDMISQRFAAKMNPLAYQRPQAPPSAGNIAQAEKVLAALRAAGSLQRRFAKLSDLQTIWTPAAERRKAPEATGGIFAHLKPKESPPAAPSLTIPPQTMTWAKFLSTVLPDAVRIEFLVPLGPNNYTALITAADPAAPPILQWDSEQDRNPVSWYVYSGGSDPAAWKLQPGAYCPVTAITMQPSMWSKSFSHQGESVMFVLEGAQDTRYERAGNGLFPEILKAEFHAIRSTIEAYSRGAMIEGAGEASACGIRLQKGASWGLPFRVTSTGGSVLNYKLDRWD